jgi:hypothetical protein
MAYNTQNRWVSEFRPMHGIPMGKVHKSNDSAYWNKPSIIILTAHPDLACKSFNFHVLIFIVLL